VNGFLLDENLPKRFAEGFTLLALEVKAIGQADTPTTGSSDAAVVQWCLDNDYVLVTKDRGRKNREMIELIRTTRVSVVMIPDRMPLPDFVRQFIRRYDGMRSDAERATARGGSFRRRMSAAGRLERL
jgi:hypothetical protein